MGERLKARDRRNRNRVEVVLSDGTNVLCRKQDMTAMIFEGQVPMAMLTAVQKMIAMPDASPTERVEALGAEHGRSLMDVMRQHACAVAIDPKIVHEDNPADPDVLPVIDLDITELMSIWVETAVTPVVGLADAARFRARASADDAAPAPTGGDVSPATEPVAVSEVELISR